MGCHLLDVCHKGIDISKNIVVDALQHIVRGVTFGPYNIGVIDKPVAERLDRFNLTFEVKVFNN